VRGRALLVVVGILFLAGIVLREIAQRRPPVSPLPCRDVAAVVDDRGDRLACPDDEALKHCTHVRPGFRYRTCMEIGPIEGAVLVARGQPLSAALASLEDFTALSGVGPAIAAKIVEARKQGKLCSAADVERISGIGPKKAQVISQYLQFDDPRCDATAR
jgi:hypothetical protein